MTSQSLAHRVNADADVARLPLDSREVTPLSAITPVLATPAAFAAGVAATAAGAGAVAGGVAVGDAID